MRLVITLVVYLFVQAFFEVTEAKGGGGRVGGGRGGSFRGYGGSRGVSSVILFTSAGRLSSRSIIPHSGGYVLSGHSGDECLPSLDAYKIKDFIEVTKNVLRMGGTTEGVIELAEHFMKLDVGSSTQKWFDLTLKLFNVHTTQSNLNRILGIAAPYNPVDDTLSEVFSADNNNKIEVALLYSSTTPENVKQLIEYLSVFNTNSHSLIVPAIDICYDKYNQIINPNHPNMLRIFPSLALLEHSMCRSGAGGKSFRDDLVQGHYQSDSSRKTSPRTIILGIDEEYVLSGHGYQDCLPSLDAYQIKDFIDVTKIILRMGETTEEVVELAEQFMKLDMQSSIQTWFDLTLRLFNVTTVPLNLTAVLGHEIPLNPLDDRLSEILSAENNDRIENALPYSPDVKDLMNYLRGFDDESYFFRIDYGVDICHDKYNEIVNPSNADLTDIFPSLVTLRDSMCRQGAKNASRRSHNLKIYGSAILSFLSLILVVIICFIWQIRKSVSAECNSNNDGK